jgi:hypothetical protein
MTVSIQHSAMTVSTQHSAFSQTEIQEVRHGEEQDSCHESTRINTNWEKAKHQQNKK